MFELQSVKYIIWRGFYTVVYNVDIIWCQLTVPAYRFVPHRCTGFAQFVLGVPAVVG